MKTAALTVAIALASVVSAEAKVIPTTSQDHTCLAKAIYYEAGSEPIAGLYAVGHVVMNRSRSGLYPKAICDVVYQRSYKNRGCQFGWTCRKHAQPKGPNWARSQQVATTILSGTSADNTSGALRFDSKRKNFASSGYQRTATIGGHSFWKPKQRVVANRQGDRK